jgi:hypothetical protein
VARFIDAQGKGVAKHQPQLWIQESIKGENGKSMTVRVPAPREPTVPDTDAEGRCRFTNLVAGVTYVVVTADGPRTFAVESGKTVDLGSLNVSVSK